MLPHGSETEKLLSRRDRIPEPASHRRDGDNRNCRLNNATIFPATLCATETA